MCWLVLKKDLKYYFKKTGNLIFVFVLPFLFILLMSTALGDFVAADFDTFEDGIVFYYDNNATEISKGHLEIFRELLKESTNVELMEVDNLAEAKDRVNRSEAFGVIEIKEDKFSYYRSPYNEPVGGKLVRGIFIATVGKNVLTDEDTISVQVIEKPRIDANAYFTFTKLASIMMFIALVIGHSVIDERCFGTIERIKLTKLGVNTMIISKVTLGVIIGLLQVGTVYILSNVFLGVNWGSFTGYMVLVLIGTAVVSAVFGAVIGMIAKTKMVADRIVLMSVMLAAYMGGSFAPVYLMQNMKIVRHVIKISPLYWTGRALNSLHAGILDKNTYMSLLVSLVLTVFFYLIYKKLSKKANLLAKAS